MTDLSGRVTALESSYAYLMQQILQKPDMVSFSTQSSIYNAQLESLDGEYENLDNRTTVLENKTINQSIEISALKARSPVVTGLYTSTTGSAIRGNIALSGINSFNVYTSGQSFIFNPGHIRHSKSIDNLSTGYSTTIFYNDVTGLTIDNVFSVVRGTSPEVSWNLYIDSSRSGSGIALSDGIVSNNVDTGSYLRSFNSYSIPTGNFLWATITGFTGTVDEIFFTVSLKT